MVVTNKNDFFSDINDCVIGIDEVGRGALSGPVVSCAILLDKKIYSDCLYKEINDSKRLSQKKRLQLSDFIKQNSIFNIGISTNKEIDNLNILNATIISMKRAFTKFKEYNLHIKIDGKKVFHLNNQTEFIIKGDQKSVSIASASIVAKVFRDNLMQDLAKLYPYYSWEKNKGYGTKEHFEAINKYGICEYHRESFLKNSDLQ